VVSETLLLRQIHPNFVQDGRPTSQAFRPTPKDENQLSVDNGEKITAAASWLYYTGTLKFESAGVMALTHAECAAEKLNVIEDGVPIPAHCYVDFSGLKKSDVEKKSKKLVAFAKGRGWLFQP
jgi:hypothetical protein